MGDIQSTAKAVGRGVGRAVKSVEDAFLGTGEQNVGGALVSTNDPRGVQRNAISGGGAIDGFGQGPDGATTATVGFVASPVIAIASLPAVAAGAIGEVATQGGITQGIAMVTAATEIKEKDRNLDKLLEAGRKDLPPPSNFKTLQERQENLAPEHQYSVENIRKDLLQGVMPTGYAPEILREQGFAPEVAMYLSIREGRLIIALENLQTQITDQTEIYRAIIENDPENAQILRNAGIDIKLLNMYDRTASRIGRGELSNPEIHNFFRSVNNRIKLAMQQRGIQTEEETDRVALRAGNKRIVDRQLQINRARTLRDQGLPQDKFNFDRLQPATRLNFDFPDIPVPADLPERVL